MIRVATEMRRSCEHRVAEMQEPDRSKARQTIQHELLQLCESCGKAFYCGRRMKHCSRTCRAQTKRWQHQKAQRELLQLCERCGNGFYADHKRSLCRRAVCSQRRFWVVCEQCGRRVHGRKGQRFCGSACYNKHRTAWYTCRQCGKVFTTKRGRGSNIFCSRPCAAQHSLQKGRGQHKRRTVSSPVPRVKSSEFAIQRRSGTGTGGDVYFIRSKTGGPVKIGVSRDVNKRLGALQTAHPYRLVVVATIHNGGVSAERSLHEQFAEFRLNGEWFEWSPGLGRLIDDLLPVETTDG